MLAWAGLSAAGPAAAQEVLSTRLLDGFEDPGAWSVVASDQVEASLRAVDGAEGLALCLDYDFNGVSGHAGIRRALPLVFPDNYRFEFRFRGDAPANDLQFKLVDASGENVWWVERRAVEPPSRWTQVRYKARHVTRAWGPDPDPRLRASAALELVVHSRVGGRGSVCFDELALSALAPPDDSPLAAIALATAGGAAAAVDGSVSSAWRAPVVAGGQRLVLDLGRVREFGGLVLDWAPGAHASRYALQLSDDGGSWRDARRVEGGDGGRDWIALPESEARFIALAALEGPGAEFALAEAGVRPLSFSAHANDFVAAVAADLPRGRYPRGFSGEQPYWTLLGLDGGLQQGLLSEDGAVEVARGGFSIEPFVLADGALVSWADASPRQSLQDGYLPIPSVDWRHPGFSLRVTAFAAGEPRNSQLVLRYRLANTSAGPRELRLALAVRPLQVNPPSQFLNTVGGVSPITDIAVDGGMVTVAGMPRVFAKQVPAASFASPFDSGDAVAHLAAGPLPTGTRVAGDPTGLASAALVYRMRLGPGEVGSVEVMVPMTGGSAAARRWWDAEALQQEAAARWRAKLDRVGLDVPPQGQALADTLRTALAHMLASRVGPRLQPGTRSYSRSWIRDGAMISEGLLRLGRADAVRDYLDWYAPYQFDDGKVPCCVDDRGSDPVPENDSHGQLVFAIAEYWRYTGDEAFLRRMWPHVLAAYGYMERLALSERTAANRALDPAFHGMMPASISHEGYSARPVHSYWDNFWALRGYKDAVQVAEALGETADAVRMAASRDRFRADLLASLDAAGARHGIDFLPGAAELGDFDATSTTIALAPGGELAHLPADRVRTTFERYWCEFVDRRDGRRGWTAYTPYEWRNVGAFVRLGWRARAAEAAAWFMDDRAPPPWNQWAEVVTPTPRAPFFLGDLPHAWVASDFVRSALDMFAYQREADDSIVLAAGLPLEWLDHGVGMRGLHVPGGILDYSLRRGTEGVVLVIGDGLQPPPGGLVLPWPWTGETPGPTTVNGAEAAWQDGELRIRDLPARVHVAPRAAATAARTDDVRDTRGCGAGRRAW
ncbi:MAG: coagulation factor 5/8 type domain-containing protein [Gammaproteobacteria bacterium]|nr:coagulation factor 5/8 type domain-containing protein [Gammaproteobacteria bacterium]